MNRRGTQELGFERRFCKAPAHHAGLESLDLLGSYEKKEKKIDL